MDRAQLESASWFGAAESELLNVRDKDSKSPSVTIGMPVYNGAASVEQALAAITEQTHTNFTLVVSDNASEDGTWEILQDWAARDTRIVLYRQKTNIGAQSNFRYVLDRADTKYFMWHAHDDWLPPNYLAELVDVANRDPECALACPLAVWLRPEGTEKNRIPFPDLTDKSRLGRVVSLLGQPESTRFYGLFRTEAARRGYGVAEEFGHVWAGDHVALLTLILDGRVRGTNRTEFYWRIQMLSSQRYRPDTVSKQIRFAARYLNFHARLFRASELSLGEKMLCWPWLLIHASKTTGFGNYRRYLRRPFRRFLVKPIGFLVVKPVAKLIQTYRIHR